MSALSVELLQVAVDVAQVAGKILAEKFEQPRTVEFKGGIDLVTDADKASEAAILTLLQKAYPSHDILAEESGAHSRQSEFRWLVDPLDGTSNYAHGVPHFSVSIGVEGPSGLLAGVVFDPMRKELFAAAQGEGATLNGRRITASSTTSLGRSLLCTGFPYDVHQRPEASVGLFSKLILKAQGIRRFGSAALDLAYVACGRFDGYFEFSLKPWDLAAGALLVQEAGGGLSSIDGTALSLATGHVVASAPGVFASLQSECTQFMRKSPA